MASSQTLIAPKSIEPNPDNPRLIFHQDDDDTIERITLGQLAVAFSKIQMPNQPDMTIAAVLARINKDRVGVAHHKGKPVTEARLRKNVGQHMWRILSALKAVHGTS